MLISLTKKIIFIANPNTGSNSIELALKRYAHIINLSPSGLEYLTWTEILEMYYNSLFKIPAYHSSNFFKFGVVRDPVEWVLSWFNYRSQEQLKQPWNLHADQYLGDKSFDEFWNSNDWVKQTNQRRYFTDKAGKCAVNYLINFGDFSKDSSYIFSQFDIAQKEPLLNLNTTENIRIKQEDLDKSLIDEIQNWYREDYEFIEKYAGKEIPVTVNEEKDSLDKRGLERPLIKQFSSTNIKQYMINNQTEEESCFQELTEKVIYSQLEKRGVDKESDEFISQSKHLEKRLDFLKLMPQGGVVAEIGVHKGYFTNCILHQNQPDRLYLIDPWFLVGKEWTWGKGNRSTVDAVKGILDYYRNEFGEGKLMLHVGWDEDVLETFKDGFFDWVYLDTSHQYEHTLRELEILKSKVKPTGIIAGDDWHPYPGHKHHGVFKAVKEFVEKEPYTIIYESTNDRQWAIKRNSMKIDNSN